MTEEIQTDVDHLTGSDRYERLAVLWGMTPAKAKERDDTLQAEKAALLAKRQTMAENPVADAPTPQPAVKKSDVVGKADD